MSRVLVVEDELHIQRLIKLILEKNSFEVTVVSTGEEALEYLKGNEQPDLVLLDILMPGIDGLQVLRTMRANASTKAIPVIMLTALAQETVVMKGIELGAQDYIRKPFHPQELVKRVARVLRNPDTIQMHDLLRELPSGYSTHDNDKECEEVINLVVMPIRNIFMEAANRGQCILVKSEF